MEAQLAGLRERAAMQDREIASLKATIAEMGPVNDRIGNLHGRLDDLEAVAHRHPEDEDDVGEDEEEDGDPEEGDDE